MKAKKSFKLRLTVVAALALGFVVAVGSFLGINLARADRTVTISGSSIFVTTADAQVWAHREEGAAEGDEAKDYTMFVFSADGDAVSYRKNLAFEWVENIAEQDDGKKDEAEGGDNTGDGTTGGDSSEGGDKEEKPEEKPAIKFDPKRDYFNMEIGFKDKGNENGVAFDKFVLTFESQQYSQTKDGKTTNYIVFEKAENGKLKVYTVLKNDDDEELKDVLDRLNPDNSLGEVENDHIKISFTGSSFGEYKLQITDGTTTIDKEKDADGNSVDLTFKNIGKTYSRYSSSSTTPVTPLSFKAVFPKEEEDADGAEGNDESADGEEKKENAFMTLYSMNGQSFLLKDATEKDGHYTGGTVNDVTPPVLCLDKAVPFIKLNSEITFDYTVIDVLTSSPSLTTYYYMLTKADAEKADFTVPVFKEDGGDYKEVSDSDDQYIFPHSKHYLPVKADITGTKFDTASNTLSDSDLYAVAAVKVALKLTDTTSTNGQSTYVLLDWFVSSDYLIKLNGDADKTYLAVATDKVGATYAYTDTSAKKSNPDENSNADWKKVMTDYRVAVENAAKGLKAGNKNYFYLPDAHTLFSDNATAYQDMTFSIYYNNGSQQQSTGKSANELSINITKSGKYIFTLYATDAASNKMYYFDGNGKRVEFETGDIWDMYKQEDNTKFEGMRDYLPWFEFVVEESEMTIEDPEEQSTAYVGSSFSPDSFEINGVSVNTVYALYQFENDLWAHDHGGVAMTYEEFVAQKDTLLDTARQYFTRIRPTSELKEDTEDYEKFNPYGWNGSSLSFTPQVANAFYLIKCEASSSETAEPVTKCMAIAAAPRVNALPGEDTWLQDNMVSIILLSIAGASLIGIILLLVIKPKNKKDVDDTPAPKNKRSV